MRTMSGGFCLHYDCSNRNSFGYCKTTVCINKHYQQEQLGSLSTTNKSESVVIKPITNADRIRAMSDEELVQYIEHDLKPCPPPYYENHFEGCMVDDTLEELITNKECDKCWLDWLRKEVEEDG